MMGCSCNICLPPLVSFMPQPVKVEPVKNRWVLATNTGRLMVTASEYTRKDADGLAGSLGQVIGVFTPVAPFDPLPTKPSRVTAGDIKFGSTVIATGIDKTRVVVADASGSQSAVLLVDFNDANVCNRFRSLSELADAINSGAYRLDRSK